METYPAQSPKKGLGVLGWLGIGCGGIVALLVLGAIIVSLRFGGNFKQFIEDAQKNPVRAAATVAITASAGQMEMAAEDDVNKRYTLREKKSGKLTTIYWNEATKKAETVEGDFTAIPTPPK